MRQTSSGSGRARPSARQGIASSIVQPRSVSLASFSVPEVVNPGHLGMGGPGRGGTLEAANVDEGLGEGGSGPDGLRKTAVDLEGVEGEGAS